MFTLFTKPERPSTARISVTVTNFQEIGPEGGCSQARIELTDTGNGKVSQSRVDAIIEVSAEVYLEFSVYAKNGSDNYLPIGIGFKAVARSESDRGAHNFCEADEREDPLGSAAFPTRTIAAKGNTAQLTVRDANPAPGLFEYSLVIQRFDGALSVIDPKIRNRGVMPG